MNEKLLKIINHYGVLPQLKYFQSEIFELNEAIIRYENEPLNLVGAGTKEYITEELADVMVMLEQFKFYYGIEDMDVKEIMIKKIDRQLECIKGETY